MNKNIKIGSEIAKIKRSYDARKRTNVNVERQKNSDHYEKTAKILLNLWPKSSKAEKELMCELLRFALFRLPEKGDDKMKQLIFRQLLQVMKSKKEEPDLRNYACNALRYAFSVLPEDLQEELIFYFDKAEFFRVRTDVLDLIDM